MHWTVLNAIYWPSQISLDTVQSGWCCVKKILWSFKSLLGKYVPTPVQLQHTHCIIESDCLPADKVKQDTIAGQNKIFQSLTGWHGRWRFDHNWSSWKLTNRQNRSVIHIKIFNIKLTVLLYNCMITLLGFCCFYIWKLFLQGCFYASKVFWYH